MTTPYVEGYVIVEKIGAGSYSNVYKAFKKVFLLSDSQNMGCIYA